MFKNYKPGKYSSYMLFFLPLIFAMLLDFSKEADTWFLLSHGRYILNNGFPYKEILSMHSDFNFIMQQWLSATVFYTIYIVFKEFGLYIFYLLMNAFITYLIYKLCMIISNKKIYASCLISVISILLLQLNFIVVRPQLFSYIFLLLLMIILHLFYKNTSSKSIYFLPLIALLLINFHASWFPMFIIVCMPYLAEYLIKKDKRFYKLLILIILSILVSLINPYGIDAVLYGLGSYGVGNTKDFIIEMMPFNLANKKIFNECLQFLAVFLIANTVMIFSCKKDKMNIHVILFIYGFFFMGLLGMKNICFYYLFALPFLSKFIKVEDGEGEKLPVKTYGFLLLIFICFFSYNIYNKEYKLQSGIEDIIEYLDNNTSKDITLYTNYDNGSYVEFYGYKPYIDTRAEVFIKKNNKKKNVLDEYFKLLKGNLDTDKFIDNYKFDYILVDESENFYNYIKNCEDYELVYSGKYKNTLLFKRKI